MLKTSKLGGILRKDGEEALLGAVGGGIAGGFSGGLAGAAAGALAGGVGAGVVGSLKAWLFSSTAATIPMNQPVLNLDNPYDEAGEWHYIMMAELVADPSLASNPDGTINYENYRNYAMNRLLEPYPEEVEMSSSFITPEWLSTTVDAGQYDNMIQFLNSLTPQQISQPERQILHAYFSAFENMGSGASFSNYSVQVENSVIAGNLTDLQKEKLLVTMATMRRGVAFYGL